MNHIEIAKQYLDELLRQRQDIVAAWVAGSVARGEETAFSDIDLVLMAAGTGEINRAGLDTWREGIYIEAGLVFQQDFSDLETVLNNPFSATQINDALILYDPTGFVTQRQHDVRAVFMQPQWLDKRLAFWLEQTRSNYQRFTDAINTDEPLEICAALGLFTFGCASIPLLRAGVTPSSSRGLALLGPIAPAIKVQLAELEGSTKMSATDVLALEPLLQEGLPLADAALGQLPIYFIQKTRWMAQQGQHQEALHAMWLQMGGGVAQACIARNDPVERATGAELMQRWLQRADLDRAEVLAAKQKIAASLLEQVTNI